MVFNLRKLGQYVDFQPEATYSSDLAVMEAYNAFGESMGFFTPEEMVNSLGYEIVSSMSQSLNSDNLENAQNTNRKLEDAQQMQESAIPGYTPNVAAIVKPFNMSKVAQSPGITQLPKQLYFSDHGQLKEYLDSMEDNMTGLMNDLAHNKISDAKEAIEAYYSRKKDFSMGIGSKEGLLDYVNSEIYQILPPDIKDEGGIVTNNKNIKFPNTERAQDVYTNRAANTDVQEAIKKIAEKNTQKKEVKSFNLNKTAQHKTQENVIMYGPAETRKVDPFSRQPISDWHIVERNKGFGLVVDDVWNIDYETIWRENIMDKYSRPYKDKEGNWVGGYIQKRFEIDKNIPASSNIQLKPGQKRRPILPEYGNTESRLQAARASGDIAGTNDTSKPFNWKEASSKKKSLKK